MKKALFGTLYLSFATVLGAQTPQLVVPIGHLAAIHSVAFSPDGKFILTGSADKTAKLWDLRGRELQTYSGHEDMVLSVAFSPDGKTVLTGGADSTARLWELNGREIRQYSDGSDYKILAAAFSPDGQKILTGGTTYNAYIRDLSGNPLRSFFGPNASVFSVAFSPDGRYVLTGSRDYKVKLFNNLKDTELEIQTYNFTSKPYVPDFAVSVAFSPDSKSILLGGQDGKLMDLSGTMKTTFSGFIWSAAFAPDGQRIITGCDDGTLALWDTSGQEIWRIQGHDSHITSVAFSPDGKSILTGGVDGKAKLWDLDGKLLQSFSGHTAPVTSATFSPNGKYVLTGNDHGTANLLNISERKTQSFFCNPYHVQSVSFSPGSEFIMAIGADSAKLWDLSGRELPAFQNQHIMAGMGAFSPDSQYILLSDASSIKLWDFSGREIRDFGNLEPTAVAFSPNGKYVLAGNAVYSNNLQLWNLSGDLIKNFDHVSNATAIAFSPDNKLVVANTKLLDFRGGEYATFTHEGDITAAAFSPGGEYVLTGSNDATAKLWDLEGHEIHTFSGHSNSISSVAFSPDGKTVLTGSHDHTVKFWDVSSGKEIATLIHIDTVDWVVFSPSGLFDASPGAMKLMHYKSGLEIIDLEQLKDRYFEPGLLAKQTKLSLETVRSVAGFNDVALYPEMKAQLSPDKRTIQVSLTARNGGIGPLSLSINQKEVLEDANPKRLKSLTIDLSKFSPYLLSDASNLLALRVYNESGWLKSAALELDYRAPTPVQAVAAGPINKKMPSLYAIVVGTANYAGVQLDLQFADRDATAFSQALRAAGSRVFGDQVFVTLLNTDPQDTSKQAISDKEHIRKAFSDIAAQARAHDVLVLYFSGHGVNYGTAENSQFFYLTKDIASESLSDPLVRKNAAISSSELTEWIRGIPALKQVLVLDACNSGKAAEDISTARKDLNSSQIRALDRMKDRTGMFILTGSAADKVSYEAGQYGQGLLTYSLLQGMSGLALTEDKRVDVMTLFQYARDKVPELAKGIGGIQAPVLAFPADGASFDIGIVDAGVKIPVAQVKPVFIRNDFQEEIELIDVLGLADTLMAHFRALTVNGARAGIIFVDVKEYENAYSMKGRYTVTGNEVVLRTRLYKGKTLVGKEFTIPGSKDNLGALMSALLEKAVQLIDEQ